MHKEAKALTMTMTQTHDCNDNDCNATGNHSPLGFGLIVCQQHGTPWLNEIPVVSEK